MGVFDKLINRTRNNGGNSYHKTQKVFVLASQKRKQRPQQHL